MEQHLVSGELLFGHILPVENDDGHTQEQVEVIRLRRAGKRVSAGVATGRQIISANNQFFYSKIH